jgi:nicotinamide-nucleotide amidase
MSSEPSATDRLGERVSEAARALGVSVGAAESLTSGALAVALGKATDASDWFAGSVVAYDASVKFDVLAVDAGPVITARAAEQMARGALRVLGADYAVAVTGAGGPGPEEGRPAGTVFVAVATDDAVDVGEHRFDGDPTQVVEATVHEALAALLRRLEG